MKKEAIFFLNHSEIQFNKISDNRFNAIYDLKLVEVYITGVGNKFDYSIFDEHFYNADFTIKAGSCAIIDQSLQLLKPYIPSFIGNNSDNQYVSFLSLPKEINLILDSFKIDRGLLTLDYPLLDKGEGELYYNNNYSLVDMESHNVLTNINDQLFIPILIGTDNGNNETKEDFIKNIDKASEKLKDVLINILKNTK